MRAMSAKVVDRSGTVRRMRAIPVVLMLLLTPSLVACGEDTDAPEPSAANTSTSPVDVAAEEEPVDVAVEITNIPDDSERMRYGAPSILVRGTAGTDVDEVTVEVINNRGRDYSRDAPVSDGRWKVRVPLGRNGGPRSILAGFGLNEPDIAEFYYQTGPTPAQRTAARRKLLDGKEAVGKTKRQLHRRLGSPRRTQDVGGQVYWYYERTGRTFQIVFAGDTAVQVNKF